MIVKGATRSGPTQLANYLLRVHANPKNETVTVLDLDYGDDSLLDAFRDWHAVGLGTRGEKTLYHAQISPAPAYAATMTREQWLRAADILTEELGLTGHPRSVILHDDGERPHIHLVYQRTDIDTMTMWDDGKNYPKHEKASMRMEEEFGHDFVPGKHAKRDRELQPEFPREAYNHDEHQIAQRTGISPEERKQQIIALKEAADTAQAFKAALEEAGYILARGDRGYLIVDQSGDHFTLARQLKEKTKEVNAFMAEVPLATLPALEDAKDQAKALRQDFMAEKGAMKQQQPQPAQPDTAAEEFLKSETALKAQIAEDARQLQQRHKAEIRQLFDSTKLLLSAELEGCRSRQDEELSKFFTKAEEFSDDWIRKYADIRLTRWNWDVADQRRIERQQEIEAIRTAHRIERETIIQTLKQERDQQIEDLKAAREAPPAPAEAPAQPTATSEELLKIETALKARHDADTRVLDQRQQAEYQRASQAIDMDIARKMQNFEAMQQAALARYDREHPAPATTGYMGMLNKVMFWLNPQKEWQKQVDRNEARAEFQQLQIQERYDRKDRLATEKDIELEPMRERHAQQQRQHAQVYKDDLKRYTEEYEAAQRLLAQYEEQKRKEERDRTRDGPEPPKHIQ